MTGLKSDRFLLYINTLRYLTIRQIVFQIWYRIRVKFRHWVRREYPLSIPRKSDGIVLDAWIEKPISYDEGSFRFLNKKKLFGSAIDWNFMDYGRLWAYNLNYMDYLLQPGMVKENGIQLIDSISKNFNSKAVGIEPYPTSLRCINWIKFFTRHMINYPHFNHLLYAQFKILADNIEFHLLGNHLLENAFSLLFGSIYFQDRNLFDKGTKLVLKELNEQILNDGGHFERSPMYHQILLERLMDVINLLQNNPVFEDEELLMGQIIDKMKAMMDWLTAMTFSNGAIPLFNDSAENVAPSTSELSEYAKRLGLFHENGPVLISDFTDVTLKDSGYRCIKNSVFECKMQTGKIGADYQPGHAHAGTFNFELYLKDNPLIVDTGTSTYERSARRQYERSTVSHNTVQVGDYDSSQVWDTFRMAKRASVRVIGEDERFLKVVHNGFRNRGTLHERKFSWGGDFFRIDDTLYGRSHDEAVVRFYFHSKVEVKLTGEIVIFNGGSLSLKGCKMILLKDCLIAREFNNLIPSKKVEIIFQKSITSLFEFS